MLLVQGDFAVAQQDQGMIAGRVTDRSDVVVRVSVDVKLELGAPTETIVYLQSPR